MDEKTLSQRKEYGKSMILYSEEATQEQALEMLQKLEDEGFEEAAIALGQYYAPIDEEKARAHFQIAADAEIPEGYWGLALVSPHQSIPNPKNKQDAAYIEYCKKAAAGANPDARNELGNIYHKIGSFVPSCYWYMLASFFDRPDANYSMNMMVQDWLSKDCPLYDTSVEDDLDIVQQRAGQTALNLMGGKGGPELLDDLMKLSEVGDPMASLMVAKVFKEYGDTETAIKYYDAAAKQEEPQAMHFYADVLTMGYGVKKDEHMALGLYNEAASRGDRYSMFQIGQYENYVSEDPLMAAYWYGVSSVRGYEQARTKLVEMAREKKYTEE